MIQSIAEQELVDRLRQLSLNDHLLILAALQQAQISHKDQTRDDGSGYLEQHVYPVTLSVIKHFLDTRRELTPEVIAAALLHDTLEDDKKLTEDLFRRRFGARVFQHVKPLTKESSDLYPGASKEERKRARNAVYYAALQKAPMEAKITKVLDRLNNVSWIHTSPDKAKQAHYVAETQRSYLSFAGSVSQDLLEMLESALETARDRCGV